MVHFIILSCFALPERASNSGPRDAGAEEAVRLMFRRCAGLPPGSMEALSCMDWREEPPGRSRAGRMAASPSLPTSVQRSARDPPPPPLPPQRLRGNALSQRRNRARSRAAPPGAALTRCPCAPSRRAARRSGARGGAGYRPQRRTERTDRAGVRFTVGTVVRHKRLSFTGVIVGWDRQCMRPEEWISRNGGRISFMPREGK